jgi:hypothetical protein
MEGNPMYIFSISLQKSLLLNQVYLRVQNWEPLLFTIFINDIVSLFKSKVLLYADDLKIFNAIKSVEDNLVLQDDLNSLDNWCIENKLFLNVKKCEVMSISRKKNRDDFSYKLGNQTFKYIYNKKYLGIIFNSTWNFSEHINEIVNRSFKMIGFLKRSTRLFENVEVIKILFNSFVRSKLEYCSSVWYPTTKKFIIKIERVQNYFLRYIYFKVNGVSCAREYPTKLLRDNCKLNTLETRRKVALLCILHKLCNNLLDCPDLLGELYFVVPRSTAFRVNRAFFVLRSHTSCFQNSSFLLMLRLYNDKMFEFCDIHTDTLPEFKNKCLLKFK